VGLFDFFSGPKAKSNAKVGDPNQPSGVGSYVGQGGYGEGDQSFADFLANGGALTAPGSNRGPVVNEYTAVALSAVWACIRVISESVAQMPIQVLETKGAGIKRPATEHPAHQLLNVKANPRQIAFNFREIMVATACLWGNAYAIIEFDKFMNPTGLHWVHPRNVAVLEYQGALFYWITGEGVPRQSYEMLHYAGLGFNGVTGRSVLSVMRENIGLGLSAQQYGTNFYQNGANVAGVLETDNILKDAGVLARLRTQFENQYQGASNSHKTMVLEQGLKYKRIGMPPEDAKFIETRKIQSEEIARCFRVPPHKIGILERSTNNNIEQQALEFVTDSLMPWLCRIEQENTCKLLREDQKGTYLIRHNADGLLRGDAKARGEFYRSLWGIGAMSANDIMDLEDRQHVPGGDTRYVPLNMVPTDLIKEVLLKEPAAKPAPADPAKEPAAA
jgi:HK97 family phage portal protein